MSNKFGNDANVAGFGATLWRTSHLKNRRSREAEWLKPRWLNNERSGNFPSILCDLEKVSLAASFAHR